MSDEHDDYDEIEYEREERPRDEIIDTAKEYIESDLFSEGSDAVFYQRQIEVRYEDTYFHWITAKALKELTDERFLASEQMQLAGNSNIRFYWSPKNRYWKRRANEIKKLVLQFSQSSVTHAIGRQGEMMFDGALPRIGFLPLSKNVRQHKGEAWTKTKHDLDRVFTCDGIDYGIEIKNTLSYIERSEMQTKLEMCKHLQLRPLFIMRMAPKSYINDIRLAGGFSLIFEKQLYPYGYEALAQEVRSELALRVQCVREVPDGHLQRLKNWHVKLAARIAAKHQKQ